MTARWDRLPNTGTVRVKRTGSRPRRSSSQWRCHACGDIFTRYAPAERHADTHGGARIEIVL